MGTGQKANILHIIDFGLCKQYRNPITYIHIPLIIRKILTGTARYASKEAFFILIYKYIFIFRSIYSSRI